MGWSLLEAFHIYELILSLEQPSEKSISMMKKLSHRLGHLLKFTQLNKEEHDYRF